MIDAALQGTANNCSFSQSSLTADIREAVWDDGGFVILLPFPEGAIQGCSSRELRVEISDSRHIVDVNFFWPILEELCKFCTK